MVGKGFVINCSFINITYKEYEEGVTSEAMLVKDLDRFDMIFQAWEYEKGMPCKASQKVV